MPLSINLLAHLGLCDPLKNCPVVELEQLRMWPQHHSYLQANLAYRVVCLSSGETLIPQLIHQARSREC